MILKGTFKPYAKDKTAGFLRLNIEDMIFLNYAVVMTSERGLWIARPQKKVKDEYKDIYFFKKEVTDEILEQIGDGRDEVEIFVSIGNEPETTRMYNTKMEDNDTDEEFPF